MEPLDLCREPEGPDAPAQGTADDNDADASAKKDPTPSQATRLVQLAEKTGAGLFHDDHGEGWIQTPLADHREHWPCRSKGSKRWLARLFWKYEGKAPNSDAISAAINVLEAQARFDGPERVLHNRVAGTEEIWYDLADRTWQAIRITPDGWRIESNPPILFRRFAHQRPQVQPEPGGDLRQLLRFVNLREPKQQLLLLAYLVSCLVPDIAHPVPVLHGPQGSAKTTLLRILRRLVDPSITETLTAPRDVNELVQQLSHHWLAFYDNLTFLPEWLSDALCRSVTGDGFSKRELYTDDEDVIYAFRRCCGLNGINVAATKPDLLDRAILFGLDGIPKENRKSETAMWREFEIARPLLVGASLDALSRAMQILPTVHLPELHRMADFVLWGCAISEALGYTRKEFLDALDLNFLERNEEVIANDPVATVVAGFMSGRDRWEGTVSDLLTELEALVTVHKVNPRSKRWPHSASTLGRRLKEVAPNLGAAGILVSQDRTGQKRCLVLVRVTGGTSDPNGIDDPSTSGGTRDSNDIQDEMPSHLLSPEKAQDPQRIADDDANDSNDGILLTSKGATRAESVPPALREGPDIAVTSVIAVIGAERRVFPSDGIGDGTRQPGCGPSLGSSRAAEVVSPPRDRDRRRVPRQSGARAGRTSCCHACQGQAFWRSTAGAVLCLTCHPPAASDLVAEQIDFGASTQESDHD